MTWVRLAKFSQKRRSNDRQTVVKATIPEKPPTEGNTSTRKESIADFLELKDSQDSHYSHNDIKKYEETIKELINVLEGTNDSIESVDSATNTTVVEKTNKEQELAKNIADQPLNDKEVPFQVPRKFSTNFQKPVREKSKKTLIPTSNSFDVLIDTSDTDTDDDIGPW
ncbi:unnamed protein product [Psylliodes chrysocephalus]|uniref:Uncharacterized protein n=1 Tax=Psylliodes chrysocephalus TaxID=3402493 RepID=A0A9P0CQK2_9CUCU|nr:unnamed protein product [Psylliodes chrysocephala]